LPGKLLTAAEFADLEAHGICVVCNWETTKTRALGGFAAGQADAKSALAVMNALAIPDDRPVYFSIDFDVTPAQQAAVDDYLNGTASITTRARVGMYGGYWTVKRCLDNGSACWAWQTGAWSPSSTTEPDRHLIDPRVHIYQRVNTTTTINGVPCDINEARQPDYGQTPGGDDVSAQDVWTGVLVTNSWGQQVHAIDIVNASEKRLSDLQAALDQLRKRLEETAQGIIDGYVGTLNSIKTDFDATKVTLDSILQAVLQAQAEVVALAATVKGGGGTTVVVDTPTAVK
jgi:hypothetical protein